MKTMEKSEVIMIGRPGPSVGSPTKANSTLERESQGCSSIVFYIAVFLMLDVWKQITSYGMKYYNNNRYPIPQTQVVALTETSKLIIFLGYLVHKRELSQVKISIWYAVPSIIYAINNNVYYFALNYVTPPIWNIIIQLRILFTALTYRLIFKREVSRIQWGALALLIGAIIMTNSTGGNKLEGSNNFVIAIALAVVGSMMSVFGTVVMEYLFKNDKRSFAEMQTQLYMFSGAMAWIFYLVEIYSTKKHEVNAASNWNVVILMVAGCIILSCTSGISVAYIIKKLDNIVKLYSQALSNMLTSIACFILFPDHFHLSLRFVICLMLMFFAVFLYENKNLDTERMKIFYKEHKSKILPILAILCICIIFSYLLLDSGLFASDTVLSSKVTSKKMLSLQDTRNSTL